MTTKIITMLITAALCSAIGCNSTKDAQPANSGNANRTASVAGGNDSQRVVSVSDGNNSIEVKQNDSDAKNKVEISGDKGEKLKVGNSPNTDDDDTMEVSDDSKGSVKTTTQNGKRTTIITDKKGDVVETKTTDKSKRTVLRDGKGDKITIGPGGVVLRDRKGNKIVVPQ